MGLQLSRWFRPLSFWAKVLMQLTAIIQVIDFLLDKDKNISNKKSLENLALA